MNMKSRNHILIVNLTLLCALALQYFLGAPIPVIIGSGILLFVIANVIFWVRLQKSRILQ